jgi:hypothetical protein
VIIQNTEFLLLLPLLLYPLLLAVRESGYARKIATTRILVILLFVLAAASPAITQLENATTDQKLNILVDNSSSMQAVEKPEIPVQGTEKVFVNGNNSRIFSRAAQNIEEGSENLLITDGQTDQSIDELVSQADQLNASISVYRLEEKKENSVKIEGPSTTVPGAQNEFTVDVSSAQDEEVPATVTLDGEVVFSGEVNGSYSFAESFDSKGEHTVEAAINSSDIFPENNRYYKTVDVQEKPEILTVGSSDALEQNLEEFYSVETSQTIPEDLDDYYSVIMKKSLQNQRLETYLAEGNGLMYTGSLEESIPDYLPVRRSESTEEESGAKIVLVIDASFGTGSCLNFREDAEGDTSCVEGSSEGGQAKESISIAYSLVDSLKRDNEIGVVAYNSEAYLISEPKSLAFNREQLKEDISRISPEGSSLHNIGLSASQNFVSDNDTVVMLSDGVITGYEEFANVKSKLKKTSNRMDAKLITVGMGGDPNRPLLEDIAENTGGYYLENDEAGRLKFRFGAGGGDTQYTPVAVVNPNHFITRGMELAGSTTGFDSINTKRSGKTLVSGSNGNEVLSTWRYGLGRVAAFSAGQENLNRLSASDPQLISRTVSWTVGNAQRKQEDWVNVRDTSRPDQPVVESSYQINGLNRESENLYSAEIEADSLGFSQWNNETYAYNYNTEKQQVGQEIDKLQDIPQETSGVIYSSENIDQLPERIDRVDREVERQVSMSPYLVALALLVFLAEVGYRKRNGRL